MMDSARFNELTEKQANPNIVMIDNNEQVRANSTKSVKKPRVEELGEDEHDGDELNPWAATKSTGKDDNISTKYFHQSMKTKVIGDRDESGGSTKPTCSVHAPEMGSTLTTHGQGTGNMWEGGRALDPSVDRLGVPRTVVQSPPLWRGPRPPDQTSPGAKGRGQGAPGGRGQAPDHVQDSGRVLNPRDNSAAPRNLQVKQTFKHKTLTDLVRSEGGQELDPERMEVCERIVGPDPDLHLRGQGGGSAGGGGEGPSLPKQPKTSRRWWKPKSGMVIRALGDKENVPTLEVEEVADGAAAAWTNTRNCNSTMMLLTLVDTGNQAVSCLPLSLFKKLCKNEEKSYQLEEYGVPVVGVGSKKIKVFGRLKQPLTLHFEGCSTPIKVRPIVISSRAGHLNVGIRELSEFDVTLHLSPEGNWLQKGEDWVKLYNKREAATAATSSDPDLLMAFVNSSLQENINEEVGEADLLLQGRAERKLRSLTHSKKVLCKNKNTYQWSDPRAAICDVSSTHEERLGKDNQQLREGVIEKQLERIMMENREDRMFISHKAKPHKKTIIPARTFLYVPCRTTFPYGTTFLCSPLFNQELHLLVARCVMTRSCPRNLVYIPSYNLTDEDITVGPDNSLALLEAGDVESINETEVVPGEEGEIQKCGDFTFPVTAKSEQGHQWLPPEEKGVADTRGNDPAQLIKFLPNFTKRELDEADDAQRKRVLDKTKHRA